MRSTWLVKSKTTVTILLCRIQLYLTSQLKSWLSKAGKENLNRMRLTFLMTLEWAGPRLGAKVKVHRTAAVTTARTVIFRIILRAVRQEMTLAATKVRAACMTTSSEIKFRE